MANQRPERSSADLPLVLVPLIFATKGTMLDNVDTFGGDASAIPFLSQEDARGMVAHVLKALFEDAFGQDDEAVLFALLRLVFRPGRESAEHARQYFNLIVASIRSRADASKLARLQGVCTFLVRNYVIVAEVSPASDSWVLRYTKTIPIYGRADSPFRRRRVRFGLQPNAYVIPLNLPFTAASYHFRMQASPNSYVKAHYLQWAKSGRTVRQEDIRAISDRAYLRIRHRQALPYAHLYTRRFDTCKYPKDMVMHVVFDEVPPGALGLTCGIALISASVITVLSFVAPSNQGRISGDVLAFLLAISPVAATFVGYSMEKLQRSSLATFLGLLATGLTSLVAALLYVRPAASWMLHHTVAIGHTSPEVNIALLAVGTCGLINAISLWWLLRRELAHYVDLLSEKNTVNVMFR
ncbi:hypothetical protein [Micromonospora arida]|uniref:hypothetical protein n=1 Tax=Micromonospora arida TaxID=2203715 RepID=UPI00340D4FA8